MERQPHVNAWKMIIKSGCAGNFAKLGIQGCWLSLPDVPNEFASRIFQFNRSARGTTEI
jgi:hypothetical protein